MITTYCHYSRYVSVTISIIIVAVNENLQVYKFNNML